MLKKIFNREAERELGFGTTVSTQTGERLMGPDGSINVQRNRISYKDNTYFHMVTMSWGHFILWVVLFFFLLNSFFAMLYVMVGIEHLSGIERGSFAQNFLEASFFSTQTLTTVGYGRVAPVGVFANLIASLESLIGLLSFALISGLLYGRFSRPMAKIVFSEKMVVAPMQDNKALMFRMINSSKSELIETEAQLIMAINQIDQGNITRRFFQMELQLSKITFFTLSWTLVHIINEKSPFWGLSQQDLIDLNAEIMVMVKGVDESNEQLVHARRSYIGSEIVWDAKFAPIIGRNKKNMPMVVTEKISDVLMLNQETQ